MSEKRPIELNYGEMYDLIWARLKTIYELGQPGVFLAPDDLVYSLERVLEMARKLPPSPYESETNREFDSWSRSKRRRAFFCLR